MQPTPEAITAYPLSWPHGWKRTSPGHAKRSHYAVTIEKAYDDLVRGLSRMGARAVVVSTNLPLRRDGRPYMSSVPEPMDRGVAVYWEQREGGKQVPRVMACDSWATVRENLRAIGHTIEALRAIERAGATELMERAFTGFAALPTSGERHWSDVLALERTATLEQVEAAYKEAAKLLTHPDRGGSHEAWVALNRARDQARLELRQ